MTARMRLAAACTLAAVLAIHGCRRPTQEAEKAPSAPPPSGPQASPLVTGVGLPLPPGDPGPVDVVMNVRADRAGRRISPLIYGINDDLRGLETQRWGLIRLGGNRYTAYNWENNASNAGADWSFQNDDYVSDSAEPAAPVLRIIDGARSIGVPTIVTISNVDYVAADKLGGGDVRKSGPKYLSTRFKRNVAQKPGAFADPPDVTDDAVYQDELVAFLKSKRPDARLLFSMDNEPDLWSHTHAAIYPGPLTYADLWLRNQRFALAIKRRWPDAEVLGFVSFGWGGMTDLQRAPDAKRGNFVAWYLDQAHAAERTVGRRLIDYLDVHWYPEAIGGGTRILSEDASAAVVAAREQAPRSLWDRSYKEESWITKSLGGPIALLPWLKTKIDAHYPGTKLAFSEWNYGGGGHISGAIAVADVLGTFGRDGVDLASYWPLTKDEPFAYAAFRAFRNFDGRGGQFGAISVPVELPSVDAITAYASLVEGDVRRFTIVLINKTQRVLRVGVRVHHSALYLRAKSYVLSESAPRLSQTPDIGAVDTNCFAVDSAPQSVTVLSAAP
jgi:hypothetical protein